MGPHAQRVATVSGAGREPALVRRVVMRVAKAVGDAECQGAGAVERHDWSSPHGGRCASSLPRLTIGSPKDLTRGICNRVKTLSEALR